MYRGRFALLRHHWVLASGKDDSHWDLLLELDSGKLLTWRILQLPFPAEATSGGMDSERMSALKRGSAICVEAIRLPDHRAIYLDYEGPIDQNRGHVARRAAGFYQARILESRSNSSLDYVGQTSSSELDQSLSQPLPSDLPLHLELQISLASYSLRAELNITMEPIREIAKLRILDWH